MANTVETWEDYKNELKLFSFEDAYTLRKAIELKKVHTRWQEGFSHIYRLELLHKEFAYDKLIENIYNYMLERVNEYVMRKAKDDGIMGTNDMEMLFRHQPEIVGPPEDPTRNYDVMNCKYRNSLVKKYPAKADLIDGLIDAETWKIVC